jgi:hypothetical protein
MSILNSTHVVHFHPDVLPQTHFPSGPEKKRKASPNPTPRLPASGLEARVHGGRVQGQGCWAASSFITWVLEPLRWEYFHNDGYCTHVSSLHCFGRRSKGQDEGFMDQSSNLPANRSNSPATVAEVNFKSVGVWCLLLILPRCGSLSRQGAECRVQSTCIRQNCVAAYCTASFGGGGGHGYGPPPLVLRLTNAGPAGPAGLKHINVKLEQSCGGSVGGSFIDRTAR